ncbi:MAG: MFS transporter [Brevefilum sp.]|nr:MFS transporter [Brevefilum sp.]
MNNKKRFVSNRWVILLLGGLTNAIVVAAPIMGMSVLLPEISKDLGLSIVQAGFVWGIGALPSIFSSLIAGTLIDRFGAKRIISISCFVIGVLGVSRALSTNYVSLLVTVFLFGFFIPFISVGNMKNARDWFKDQQLGIANGILALGMAFGFFLGSMISASFISPWVGGWRNTFIFYGVIAIVFMVPWFLTPTVSSSAIPSSANSSKFSAKENIQHIIKINNIWLLGLAFLCVNGAVQGFLGYLPLYLRNSGWAEIKADTLAASFHFASMLFVIPLTLLSDKLGLRKKFILMTIALTTLGMGMVGFLNGDVLWLAVFLAGFARDATMAILFTLTMETKGVGLLYAGISTGFINVFVGLGSLIFPPLGNNFVVLAPNIPLIFWSVSCLIGLIFVSAIKANPRLEKEGNKSGLS